MQRQGLYRGPVDRRDVRSSETPVHDVRSDRDRSTRDRGRSRNRRKGPDQRYGGTNSQANPEVRRFLSGVVELTTQLLDDSVTPSRSRLKLRACLDDGIEFRDDLRSDAV
ncbi:hypothetical protein HPB52_025447 [Rhipicephalus sanguineus]|uniref:Uncharacterized protein n=1 Tax=Rhipicephalus sanguineus TaxID=34632 RepID=A0A9D4P9T1_RHISA|nr:hypothetical protein HPB52_025447 [Rhipicephalus sanguineus]